MQSFATQLLFRFFFDDNLGGQEYLKRTVWRVVDTMADMKAEQLGNNYSLIDFSSSYFLMIIF